MRIPFPVQIGLSAVAGVVSFVIARAVGEFAVGHIHAIPFALVVLAVVLLVARAAGILFALPVGTAAILAYDWFFLPPFRDLNEAAFTLLGTFLGMAVIVGAVTTETSRRAVEAERARGDMAEVQASLRRLALLIAQGEAPQRVFEAATREVRRHLGSDTAALIRYELDGSATELACDGSNTAAVPPGLIARVRETAHASRLDATAVGVPIVVNGRLWGMFAVGSAVGGLPGDTETRTSDYTELVATAVADAQSRAELISSRARIVAAADEARRRIERDLHDGAQQRLVALALRLRTAAHDGEKSEEVAEIGGDLMTVIEELRELSRGIHPAVLSDNGLRPALRALARRSPLPVEVDVELEHRLPQPVEVGAYYVVSEVLTNAVKHAGAEVVDVWARVQNGSLRIRVHDDGAGGANFSGGTGLLGLKDRIEALGGSFDVSSPAGAGTTVTCRIPL
ncbi:histidine kinase [Paractinoplanes abujensis]|uniref:histidine kinase n=1 Tax=Paractinoplanes abujensis TaxID=882441 RepID=A0A7W7CRV8_9ACTN|nr:ATP-binding protein [Actinoplanes abujensis]MBB4692180.1 signal transduction histidine kinase [Actinoplanes abujensis]GID24342.1 histidine kinase [Actinoplanes abujensis]